jgi:hypothetical protein
LRAQIELPLVLLKGAGSDEPNKLVVGENVFELPPDFDADRDVASELLALLAHHVDLAEPFERIREAIREAQRLGERSQDAHEQAA